MLNALWQKFSGLIITLIALALVVFLIVLTVNSARGSENSLLGDADGEAPSVSVLQNGEDGDVNVGENDPNASTDEDGVVAAEDDPDTENGETLEDSVAQSSSQDSDTGTVAGATDDSGGSAAGTPSSLPITGPGEVVASITAVMVGVAGGYWFIGQRQLKTASKRS